MSSASPFAPGPVGKPFTSVPEGDEIASSICVVTPTSPIFAPFSIRMAEGTILPFCAEASSSPEVAVVST